MQHSTRIGEALLALQQAGNYKYSNWKCKFFVPSEGSGPTDLIYELSCEAEKMEEELINWKKEIEEARNQCYQLNYFTAQQLLLLRSELARLRSNPQQDVKPSVMHLLSGLSLYMSPTTVKSSVCNLDVEEGNSELNPSVEEISDIQQTPSKKPEPIQAKSSLSLSDLTNEQHESYVKLLDDYAYEQDLILNAIAESKSSDLNVLEKWCSKNEKNFNKLPSDDEYSGCDSESDDSTAESEGQDLFATFDEGRPSIG